jgi:hypothetical protein
MSKPIRVGNAFPWKGILAGVGRMVCYLFLLAGLVLVLGAIVVWVVGAIDGVSDKEPVEDYF